MKKLMLLTVGLFGMAMSFASVSQAKVDLAENQIADCTADDADQNGGSPSRIQVFMKSDSATGYSVKYSAGPKEVPEMDAVQAKFSPDKSTLAIAFAKGFVIAHIVRGDDTVGDMGVMLGAPPSKLICTAKW